MSDTSLNSRPCFSSGVTSLVTVLPPSFVRSLATPDSICGGGEGFGPQPPLAHPVMRGPGATPRTCAIVTYRMAVRLGHPSCQPKRRPIPASCSVRPVSSVDLMPQLAPAIPASRFVTTPAAS